MCTASNICSQIVTEQSAALNVPSEVKIGQNADHRDMARFVSIHDRNFRPMLTRLDMFQTGLASQLDSSTQESLKSRSLSLSSRF